MRGGSITTAVSAGGKVSPAKICAGIVGHANLALGASVARVLEGHLAASPNRFRGIRHSVTWDPHPEVENTAAHKIEGQLGSDQFRAGAHEVVNLFIGAAMIVAWLGKPGLP